MSLSKPLSVMRQRIVARIEQLRAISIEDEAVLSAALHQALKDTSASVRTEAIEIANKQDLRSFEPLIRKRLADRVSYVRCAAVEYLGNFYEGEGIAVPFLYPHLADSDSLTRLQTIESLGWVGDVAAYPLIAACLHDADPLVRAYAAAVLGSSGLGGYRTAIARTLAKAPQDDTKPFFVQALFELGDESKFAAMLELLASTRYIARCAAANGLAAMPLNAQQRRAALRAVADAEVNFLFRADQSTMEKVKAELKQAIFDEPGAANA